MEKMRSTIYVTKVKWDRFLATIDREGRRGRNGVSASAKIEEFIDTYLVAHGDGNPQTMIEYLGLPQTMPLFRTCAHSKKGEDGRAVLTKGEFFCSNDGHWKIPEACTRCRRHREAPW